jgi:hypothetical protein
MVVEFIAKNGPIQSVHITTNSKRHHNIKCVIFLAAFMYCVLSLVNVNRPIHGWHVVANDFSLNESRA